MKPSLHCILLSILVVTCGPALAELGVGEPLPQLQLRDQHEQPQAIPPSTRLLLFAPDRAAGDLATQALADQDAASLAAGEIRYLADISGMPGLITSLFALPKLRERPYPILLGEQAEQTAALPRKPDQVTLLRLDHGRILDIEHFSEVAPLRAALGLP